VQTIAPTTLLSASDAPLSVGMTPQGAGNSVARSGRRRFGSFYRAALGGTFAVFAVLAVFVWISLRSPGTRARNAASPSVSATSASAPSVDEQPLPDTRPHAVGSFELLPSRIPAPPEPHAAGGVRRFVPAEQRAGAPRSSAPTATATETPPPKPVRSEPALPSPLPSASSKWDPFGSRL
jgi:hypothetical protein